MPITQHCQRNVAEYEGYLDIDEQILNDLLTATTILLKKIENLSIPKTLDEL